MASNQTSSSLRVLKTHILILGLMVGGMWLIEVVNFVSGESLDQYGIVPRNITGLRGILFAPFLHAGFGHLIANTLPLLCLGWFIMVRRIADFFLVTLLTMLISGLGTWLIAPAYTLHIGASGLVFGYLGFLLSRGLFERSPIALFWAIAAGAAYGGVIWGVLPGQPGVSWQAHFFGFVGGVIAAWLLTRWGRKVR